MKRLVPKMKYLALFIVAGVLFIFAAYNVFAQKPKELMGEGMMMQQMNPGYPMGNCPMCATMCKSMVDKAMAATSDGGIVVMVGYKLIKFDRDLNKVKEAQIAIDTEEIQTQMQKMMQSCPMCAQMMKMREGMMPMKGTEKRPSEHPTSEHPR